VRDGERRVYVSEDRKLLAGKGRRKRGWRSGGVRVALAGHQIGENDVSSGTSHLTLRFDCRRWLAGISPQPNALFCFCLPRLPRVVAGGLQVIATSATKLLVS
jgi:hypothetical protein